MTIVWHEPARSAVIGAPDVLVVGGGSAESPPQSRLPVAVPRVWLVERYGFIGGLADVRSHKSAADPDDGCGTQVVAGLCQEFVDRLDGRHPRRRSGAHPIPAVEHWRQWGLIWAPPDVVRYSVALDPEDFCDVSFDLLRDRRAAPAPTRGARTHTPDGRIEAVVLESKRGREVVQPSRDRRDGRRRRRGPSGAGTTAFTIPPWLWFRMGGLGELDEVGFRTTRGPSPRAVGSGRSARDPTDPDDLTAAELACRDESGTEVARIREQHPGAWLDDIAKMIGITESRPPGRRLRARKE
jgi:hypothetical protein